MMRISRKTDYGLIALKHISTQGDGKLVNAREIASQFNLPANLLAKVLHKLSQSGIVEAQKGSGGGYRMTRDPATVTLTEIFESIEGPVHMVVCSNPDGGCTLEDRCTIKNGLMTLEQKFIDFFNTVTISEI